MPLWAWSGQRDAGGNITPQSPPPRLFAVIYQPVSESSLGAAIRHKQTLIFHRNDFKVKEDYFLMTHFRIVYFKTKAEPDDRSMLK